MTLVKTLFVAAIAFASQSVFAQNVRPCTNEVLSCKLENAADFYHRTLLGSVNEPFSGVNDDEPSIQPDECKIVTGLSDKENFYTLLLGDKDYTINIFARSLNSMGKALPGEATFAVVPGKTFYYRYNDSLITCVLK